MKSWGLALLLLMVAGCSGHGLKDLAGSWKSPGGTDYVFDGSNIVKVVVHRNGKDIPEVGEIRTERNRFSMTITSVNGRPISQIKAALERKRASLTPRLQSITETLGKATLYELGPDGRTLTKLNAVKPLVLTKQ